MGSTTAFDRQHRSGFVLLSTLITLLLLASLVTAVTVRAQSNVRVMARLTVGMQKSAAKSAGFERLRGLIADAMTGTQENRPLLDGTTFAISEQGQNWAVRVQDVEGLVDVYLAPTETLNLLPIEVDQFVQNRTKALSTLQPGERFPTLASSLARFGVTDANLYRMSTQSSQTGSVRVSTMPDELQHGHPNIVPGAREGEQVVTVHISIE